MSDIEEAEYEVESIIAAKVEAASRSKKAKLIWKYLVRWKGYTPDDDTWEPVGSFVGSEDVIENFWKRSSTNGRDRGDMSLFRSGEEFQLIGPPRHKRKSTGAHGNEAGPKKSPEENEQEPLSLKSSSKDKRQRSPDMVESTDMPTKRSRGNTTQAPQPVASSSKPRSIQAYGTRSKDRISSVPTMSPSSSRRRAEATLTPAEIVPDSDEDNEEGKLLQMPPAGTSNQSTEEIILLQAGNEAHNRRSPPIVIKDDSLSPTPTAAPKRRVDEDPALRIPAHRARLANPRVKLLDDSQTMDIEGSISTKVRAVKGINVGSSASALERTSGLGMRSRPGPGRNSSGIVPGKNKSSLLTAKKGALKTVKGKYGTRSTKDSAPAGPAIESMDVDSQEGGPPPSAEELLKLAGLNSESAEALSDFEDGAQGQTTLQNATPPSPKAPDQEKSERNESLELAKNKLFPPQTPSKRVPEVMNWGTSTIFGPLSLGSTSTSLEQTMALPLFLNLDSSVAIPISVSDVYIATQLHLNQEKASQQVPGKFYESEAALHLLSAVRATGQSALVTLGDAAPAGDKGHFDLFRKRLQDGDIYVAVAGLQILVFSSTSNTLLSSRLNAPGTMLNLPGNILISHVDVESYSGYADAASKADPRRWSQYVSSQ